MNSIKLFQLAITRLTNDGQELLFFTLAPAGPFAKITPRLFLYAPSYLFSFRSDAMQLKKVFNWAKNT
jgi:hypothetical protein